VAPYRVGRESRTCSIGAGRPDITRAVTPSRLRAMIVHDEAFVPSAYASDHSDRGQRQAVDTAGPD